MDGISLLRDDIFFLVVITVFSAVLCYKILMLVVAHYIHRVVSKEIPDLYIDEEKTELDEKIYSLSLSRIQGLLVSTGSNRSLVLKFNPYIWVFVAIFVLTNLNFYIFKSAVQALIASMVTGTFVAILFAFFSYIKSNAYKKKFEVAFQKFLNDFELALRSGSNVRGALSHGYEQSSGPLKMHLRSLITKIDSGETFDRSLSEFANATPIDDSLFFSTLLIFQNKAGGSLVRQVNQLKNKLESRRRRAEKMKGLTAQTRTSFKIMMILPILAASTSWYTDRERWIEVSGNPQFYEFIGLIIFWQILGILLMHFITKP